MVGLSGAGVRWYRRFLASGTNPDEARAKAEEHRNSDPYKRGNKTLTPQDRDNVKKQRVNDDIPEAGTDSAGKDYAGALKAVKLAVLPLNYPTESLNQAELEEIERAIFWDMAEAVNVELRFNGLRFKAGMLIIECIDEPTAEWVRGVVPNLSTWKGVQLSTREGDDIPKPHTITLFLPKCTSHEEQRIINVLGVQNHKLHVADWKVIRGTLVENGLLLNIGVGELALNALIEANFKVNYRWGYITARLSGGKHQLQKADGDTTSTATTAPSTITAPSTTTSTVTEASAPADPGEQTSSSQMEIEEQIDNTVLLGAVDTQQEERILLGEEVELNSTFFPDTHQT